MNNFEIGEFFEEYVVLNIFKNEYFKILHKTPRYNENYFVESALNPDFKLRCKETNIEFWIECKFRSKKNKKYNINKKQFQKFKEMEAPIFYIIGLGENPSKPEQIGLFFINSINYNIDRETILKNLIKKTEIKNFNELIALTKT